MSRWLAAALLWGALGCKESPSPPAVTLREARLGAQRCSGQPGPKNPVLKVLQRPFDDQFPVYNLFDHDLPVTDALRVIGQGDKELTYCGLDALGLAEGYSGYAFGLPAGTPVLAAAGGIVVSSGAQNSFSCPLTMRAVNDQLAVELRHEGLGGVGFITRYVHLAKTTVKTGDTVVAGQRLGLSGQSGCAAAPLLYFEVRRLTGAVVDPYGWDGPGDDPWAKHEGGAPSVYLWKDGEAPTLRSQK